MKNKLFREFIDKFDELTSVDLCVLHKLLHDGFKKRNMKGFNIYEVKK